MEFISGIAGPDKKKVGEDEEMKERRNNMEKG